MPNNSSSTFDDYTLIPFPGEYVGAPLPAERTEDDWSLLIEEYEPQASQEKMGGLSDVRGQYVAPLPENFLVKHLLPRVGVGMLFGESGCGKTYTILHLAATISSGRGHWCGEFASRGAVLFCEFEPGETFDVRLRTLSREINGGEPFNNLLLPNIGLQYGNARLMNEFDDLIGQHNIDHPDAPVRLVVLDTVSQCLAGSGTDSNNQDQTAQFIAWLKVLAEKHQCCFVGIGHVGKDSTKGMIGSKAWFSNSDFMMYQQKATKSLDVDITYTKSRSRSNGQKFSYSLKRVRYEQQMIDALEHNHALETAARPGIVTKASNPEYRDQLYYELTFDDTEQQPQTQSMTERAAPDADFGPVKLLHYCLQMHDGCAAVSILRDDFNHWAKEIGKPDLRFDVAVRSVTAKQTCLMIPFGDNNDWLSYPEKVCNVGREKG
ncbi:AAA family ATPase [Salmonella enterica]